MKEGWKMVKLGEVCEIINGRNQKNVLSTNGQYPILGSGGNIMGYATEYLCPAGTTIIGRKGSINNPLFIGTPFWNVDTAFGFNAKSNYECKLLYYFCLSFDFNKLNKGTTLPSLVKSDLLQIPIPLPPLEEQHRIVGILDAAFAKIDALKANAEANLKNAKALFQQVLAEELKPKEGWKMAKLGEVCDEFGEYGMSVSSKQYDGTRYIRITDITENGSLNDDYVSADIDCIDEKYRLQEGDVLFARTGATVGKTLVYRNEFGDCVYAGYLIRYRPNLSIVLPQFLFYCTHYQKYYDWVKKNQKAAAQPNISAKLYNGYEIPLPPLEEQHRILATLDALSEKCRRLEQVAQQTIAECDALKQSILHQAFSGEL